MPWPLSGNWDLATSAGAYTQDRPAIMAAIARAINERWTMCPTSVDPDFDFQPGTITPWGFYTNDALTTAATYPTAADFSGATLGPCIHRFLLDAYHQIDQMIGYYTLFRLHYPWVRDIGTGPSDVTYWTPTDLWAAAGAGLKPFDADDIMLADNWLRLKRALDLMTVYAWDFYSTARFGESNAAFTDYDQTPPIPYPAITGSYTNGTDTKGSVYDVVPQNAIFGDYNSCRSFAMSSDAHGISRQLDLWFFVYANNLPSTITAKAAYYWTKTDYITNNPLNTTWRDGFDLRVDHIPNISGTPAPSVSTYYGPYRLERDAATDNFYATGADSTFYYSLKGVNFVTLKCMNGGDKNPFHIIGASGTHWGYTGIFACNYARYAINLAPALSDQ